jgi:pimeloyl-ACP methyl ester carboxylesterase
MHYGWGMTTLKVSGATLHYQVQGRGPVLLIIMGGSGDADAASGIVGHLSSRYTVVTYDRRGLSRSVLDDPGEPMSVEQHSEDAHRVLAAVTSEPAFVLGSSLGALIALDLVARHPGQVRLLVAHEPPMPALLPEAERAEAKRFQRILESGPAGPEWTELMRVIAVDHADVEEGVTIPAPSPQQRTNAAFFREHDAPVAHRYQHDLDALKTVSDRIIAAGGEKSRDAFPHRSTRALADRLGTAFVEFPGDHAGFATRPRAFADRLAQVLTEASTSLGK